MGAAGLGGVFASAQGWRLAQAALVLADGGVPVFPCAPGGKHPLTRRGFLDATCDPARVAGWWGRHPDANIAMPTGPVSGWDVIDIDVRPSGSGFDQFAQSAAGGLGEGWAVAVRTPSGGLHLYHPADPAVPNRCWSLGGAHVDFRGAGGYVIVPPSLVTGAGGLRRYRVERVGQDPAPVDAARLKARLGPAPAPGGRPARAAPDRDAAARRLARWVSRRVEGERNQALHWAASRMAEAGDSLDTALAVLGPAAQTAGLPGREAAAAVRSAYRRAAAGPAPVGPAPVVGAAPRREVLAL